MLHALLQAGIPAAVATNDEEAAATLEISFARRLDPAVVAYCQSEETRDRAIRLARRRAVMKKKIRRPSVAGMASASSIPSQKSAAAETKKDEEQARAAFIARQPMGRLGTTEEIAALAVYLASDESAFTTATFFTVDGGILM